MGGKSSPGGDTCHWPLAFLHRIRDNGRMAKRTKSNKQWTGLYHARQARGMSRTELVKRSGVSKQQLSRLENGLIRMRLDHLKPFSGPLDYSPEQILLWGRYPGTEAAETNDGRRKGAGKGSGPPPGQVPELDLRGPEDRETRKSGRHADPVKPEGWLFPASFVREQLHTTEDGLLVLDTIGDSMAPTVMSGDRVVIDTGHKSPTPDGIYAIRDTFKSVVVRRLQLLRAARPPRVKIISDNPKNAAEEVPLSDLEIVGKALCCVKVF
jgi:transcriptional regulator with XRE-family HTH domain